MNETLKCMKEIYDKNIEDIKDEIQFIVRNYEEMKEDIKQLKDEEMKVFLSNRFYSNVLEKLIIVIPIIFFSTILKFLEKLYLQNMSP